MNTDNKEKGKTLHGFVLSGELLILNRNKEPTIMDRKRREVLDITICTMGVVDRVEDYRISKELPGWHHCQIRQIDRLRKKNKPKEHKLEWLQGRNLT